MSRYTAKREYVWNTEIAYLTGLIASDGCLANDGRHLNLTSKDIELIDIVQEILDMQVKVSTKTSSYGGWAYNLQFSNVTLYDFFLECGLTPAKSKTISQLAIPDAYFPDFLRGYFDGDGTVYGYWDPRWRSSLMYYTGFVSASPAFLLWLQDTNSRLADTSPGRIKPGMRASTLSYAKSDSQKLFTFMYYNRLDPKLSRKYDKFVHFLQADPYVKIHPDARVL